MRTKKLFAIGAAAAVGGVLLGWPMWASVAWARYGHTSRDARRDALIDRLLPVYEVAETHETRVAAPASLTYAALTETGFQASAIVRTIIHARERLLRVPNPPPLPSGGIVTQLQSWGWGVLAEAPNLVIVLGTVTQPWEGDVRFHALPPEEFVAFDRPGYLKIVVTLSVDAIGADNSIARVHTRVATTDPAARARFRRYWATFSPGILLIRRALLREVRLDAEHRHRDDWGRG
jgi:hypothetical protein